MSHRRSNLHHSQSLPDDPSRRRTLSLGLVIVILLGINLYVFLWRGETSIPEVMKKAAVAGRDSGSLLQDSTKTKRDLLAQLQKEVGLAEDDIQNRVLIGQVLAGDSMGKILRREGLEINAADELIRSLSGTLDFLRIKVGQSYRLEKDMDGMLIRFEFNVSSKQQVEVLRNAEGILVAKVVEARG